MSGVDLQDPLIWGKVYQEENGQNFLMYCKFHKIVQLLIGYGIKNKSF